MARYERERVPAHEQDAGRLEDGEGRRAEAPVEGGELADDLTGGNEREHHIAAVAGGAGHLAPTALQDHDVVRGLSLAEDGRAIAIVAHDAEPLQVGPIVGP